MLTLGLAAGLAAGCGDGGGGPVELAVTTPPASATAGSSSASGSTVPPPASATATPPPVEDPGGTGTAGPAATYAALVREWQSARGQFFAALSAGRALPVEQENALAARFLAGQRRFATALRSYPWPAPARPAVRRLQAENAIQQRYITAMAEAGTAGEFTGRLADYGVGTPAENRAVAAVTAALN